MPYFKGSEVSLCLGDGRGGEKEKKGRYQGPKTIGDRQKRKETSGERLMDKSTGG